MTNTLIDIRILQVERKALKEALRKYGRHTESCPVSTPGFLAGERVVTPPNHPLPCVCGWEELEKAL